MKPTLMSFLVCPICFGHLDLSVDQTQGEEIFAGQLGCTSCARSYPVVRGIPRFVSQMLREEQKTAENFGYQWTTFTHGDPFYEQQLLDWLRPVHRAFFQDKIVLDAGCGKGRHLPLAASFGARQVIGVDFSQAVETAFTATAHLPNVHIVQASIYQLPFPRIFDYIYCVGVLHHLPSPEEGYRCLQDRLNDTGALSFWVYGRENNGWILWLINPLRRLITSRISPPWLKGFSLFLASLLFPVVRGIYRPLEGTVFSRFLFYHDYLTYISHLSFRELVCIVFDQLVAPIAFYLPRAEIERWFETQEFSHWETNWHNQNSWRCFLQK